MPENPVIKDLIGSDDYFTIDKETDFIDMLINGKELRELESGKLEDQEGMLGKYVSHKLHNPTLNCEEFHKEFTHIEGNLKEFNVKMLHHLISVIAATSEKYIVNNYREKISRYMLTYFYKSCLGQKNTEPTSTNINI